MLDVAYANYSKTLPRTLLWVEEGQERARVQRAAVQKQREETEQNMAEKGSKVKRKIGSEGVSTGFYITENPKNK